MTKIRMVLYDHDFETVYRKGSANTNADVLFRLRYKSNTLKEMIPTEIELKILPPTCSMTKQNNNTAEKD